MKSPLVIISITVAALLIIAGAGYFIFGNLSPPEPPTPSPAAAEPPPPPSESAPPEPPAPVKESEPPAPSFEEKIEDFIKAMADVSASGESKEVTLVLTEAEVNQQAAMVLAQAEIPEDIPLEIKSVHLDLQADNNLVNEVETVTYGFEVTIKVKTKVGVKEGKPDVEITDVSFGFIPLPAAVKDKIVDFLKQKIDDSLVQLTETGIGGNGKVDLEFKDINVQEEDITITVIIKPKE
jgi:uncharacterized protein YpmS